MRNLSLLQSRKVLCSNPMILELKSKGDIQNCENRQKLDKQVSNDWSKKKKSPFNSAREKKKKMRKSMIDMLFEIPTHSSSRMAYLEDLRVLKGKLANYYVETLITKYCLAPCIIERCLVYDS